MNKQKALLKKFLSDYKEKTHEQFSGEEGIYIAEMIAKGFLAENAFKPVIDDEDVIYMQALGENPLTGKGYDFIEKSAYQRFRDGKAAVIIRDVMLAVAFLVSLSVGLIEVLRFFGG